MKTLLEQRVAIRKPLPEEYYFVSKMQVKRFSSCRKNLAKELALLFWGCFASSLLATAGAFLTPYIWFQIVAVGFSTMTLGVAAVSTIFARGKGEVDLFLDHARRAEAVNGHVRFVQRPKPEQEDREGYSRQTTENLTF